MRAVIVRAAHLVDLAAIHRHSARSSGSTFAFGQVLQINFIASE